MEDDVRFFSSAARQREICWAAEGFLLYGKICFAAQQKKICDRHFGFCRSHKLFFALLSASFFFAFQFLRKIYINIVRAF